MAIDDALAAAARDWDRVAALLSTDELGALAAILDAASAQGPEAQPPAERALVTLSAALPDDDPVWDALEHGTRRFAEQQARPDALPLLRQRVAAELSGPGLPEDHRAEQVERAARASIRDALAQPDAARAARGPADDALVLTDGDRSWAPAFQFLPDGGVDRSAAASNEALGAREDPWGAASWWLTRHARLAARPIDLLGTTRAAEVVRAAELNADDGF